MFIIVPPDTIMKVPYNRHNQSTPTTDTKKKSQQILNSPPIGWNAISRFWRIFAVRNSRKKIKI